MSDAVPTETVTIKREHAEAAFRVLDVVAGCLGQLASKSNPLMCHGSDLWTVREIRDHAKAAAKMLKKDLKR